MSAKLVRFLGNYDINAEGKFLWELLAQLRQFGVGRIVTKHEWARKWPDQPSYLRIQRVAPAMDRWLFGGSLWAEWVVRGRRLGVYEADWRLIHRRDEAAFTKCEEPFQGLTFPDTFPLPPLQVHMAKKTARKQGLCFDDAERRAPLALSVDPEFAHLASFIGQVGSRKCQLFQAPPVNISNSIYDEVDKKALLDLYGKELPFKIEAWSTEPASYKPYFSSKCKGTIDAAE